MMKTKEMNLSKLPFKNNIFWMVVQYGVCCAFILGFSPMAFSQDAKESRGITVEEYAKAKTFTLKNLDEDTYVKFENNYILDRYQMKPPYVFKYSDGIERRIYLYKLLDNKTKQEIAMLAIYYTPGNGKAINLCIPNAAAPKEVWVKYIDDLKEYGAKENGLLSAYSYVLSKEMSGLLNSGSGQPVSTAGSKTDYDVCFPKDALVTLANGSEKTIEQIQVGDQVASFNEQTGAMEPTAVVEIQIHERKVYNLTSVKLLDEKLTASLAKYGMSINLTLEATPNHPVLTMHGRKAVGKLEIGEYVHGFDSVSGEFSSFKVIELTKNSRTTTKVYNLVTAKKNYIVNNTVVLDK